MAKTKIDKEVMKEHMEVDELEVYVEKIVKWIRNNTNTLIIIAILIGLAAIGTTYLHTQKEAKSMEAQSILDETMRLYNTLLTETNTEKMGELSTQIGENADSLASSFKGYSQTLEALFIKGKSLFYQNKFDDAIKIFNEYIAQTKKSEEKARGYLAIGYTLENKAFLNNDNAIYEEAIKTYNKAAEFGNESYIKLEALYNIGKIYKNLGKKELALEAFEKISMSKLALDTKRWGLTEGSSGFIAKAEEEKKELLEK